MQRKIELRTLLERHVKRGPDCWEWQDGCDKDGYGKMHKYEDGERKTMQAHRVAWELEYGPILNGLYVLHRCDNPSCVRPSHLFLGTTGDNIRDASSKGRMATGKRNGRTRLTRQQVRAIRERYAAGEGSYNYLGRRYNVSSSTIRKVVKLETWRNV